MVCCECYKFAVNDDDCGDVLWCCEGYELLFIVVMFRIFCCTVLRRVRVTVVSDCGTVVCAVSAVVTAAFITCCKILVSSF